MPSDAQIFFDRLLPESLEAILAGALGRRVPRRGPDDTFRISSCGRFSGRIAADLLAFAKNQRHDGAFVLLQEDVTRVLYLQQGVVVGAESNVLFERLGRVLLRQQAVDAALALTLVATEERRGTEAAAALLPPAVARQGVEARAVEVGTSLTFMSNAYFLYVDGAPVMGTLPVLALSTVELAIEGLRRYDEWRHKSAGPARPAAPADEPKGALEAAPGSKARPATPEQAIERDVDEIMRLMRDERGSG